MFEKGECVNIIRAQDQLGQTVNVTQPLQWVFLMNVLLAETLFFKKEAG